MSYRNTVIIWISCLVFIIAVTLAFATNLWVLKARISRLEAGQQPDLDDIVPQQRASQAVPSVSVTRQDSIKTIKRLRELLEQRTELYRKQKSQLIRRVDEHDKLRSEFARLSSDHEALQRQYNQLWRDADSSLMMLGQLLGQDAELPENVEPEAGPSSEDGADNGSAGDNADAPPANGDTDLDQMRIDLSILEWQLEQALAQAGELESDTSRLSQISNAASMVLDEIGPTSVPFLAELLNSREPVAVRVWAAWILGNMGASAAEARGALRDLLVDGNGEVAQAAKEALEQIEGTGTQ